ncbi:hypothetical protein DY000_02045957 [Brassica cretica]|uniref:Uncharacterized protein n=1 Tax=Brassica cretica TaxID=69181 RepID=A0ABQ7F662_BRACR|nr:hypothetical protein DY000_02045957 [Brassica cretica]
MRFSASTCTSSTPEETGRDRRTARFAGAQIPAEPPPKPPIFLAFTTCRRDQSKHEIISAFEPLKTLDARIENHLTVDLTDFTSSESFIIKTRTPPP